MPEFPERFFESNLPSDDDSEFRIRCPNCSERVGGDDVLCIRCGYHFPSGRVLAAPLKASPPEDTDTAEDDRRGTSAGLPTVDSPRSTLSAELGPPELKPISWGKMFAALTSAEVIAETMAMTLLYLGYSIYLGMIWSSITLGVLGMILNGSFVLFWVRYYVIVHEASLVKMLGGLFLLIWLSMGLGRVLKTFGVIGGASEFLIAMYLPAVIMALAGTYKLAAVFCGNFLGTCDRAARGSLLGEGDHRGLLDVARCLLATFVGAFPLVIASALVAGINPTEPPFWLPVAAAGAWLLIYFPMAFGMIAVSGEVKPWVVMRCIWQALPDYIALLVVLVGISAACAVIASSVAAFAWNFDRGSAGLQFTVRAIAIFPILAVLQYAAVAQATLVGFVLRRNASVIGWYESDTEE